MQLYELLPLFVRLRDSATAGTDTEGIIERIVSLCESEADITVAQINGLLALVDPDECNQAYLFYLTASLGLAVQNSIDVPLNRWLASAIIHLFRIRGTHLSWKQQWAYIKSEKALRALELWKSQVYERGDYYQSDVYGSVHAARVDLYYAGGAFLTVTEADVMMASIDWCRPAHVLLRRDYQQIDATDVVATTQSDAPTPTAVLSLADWVTTASEELDITITCVVTCETVCEPSREVAGCLTSCETSCEPWDEFQGMPGPAGANGADGAPGPAGANGADGSDACIDTSVGSLLGAEPTLIAINSTYMDITRTLHDWQIGERVSVTIYDPSDPDVINLKAVGTITDIVDGEEFWYDQIVTDIAVPYNLAIARNDPVVMCHGPVGLDGADGSDACIDASVGSLLGVAPTLIAINSTYKDITRTLHDWQIGERVSVTIYDPSDPDVINLKAVGTITDIVDGEEVWYDQIVTDIAVPYNLAIAQDDPVVMCHGPVGLDGCDACELLTVVGVAVTATTARISFDVDYPHCWAVGETVCVKIAATGYWCECVVLSVTTSEDTVYTLVVETPTTRKDDTDLVVQTSDVATVCHGKCATPSKSACEELDVEFTEESDEALFFIQGVDYPKWTVDEVVCISGLDENDEWHSSTGTITTIEPAPSAASEFMVTVQLTVAISYVPAAKGPGIVCHGPCASGGDLELDYTRVKGEVGSYTSYSVDEAHPETLDEAKVEAGEMFYIGWIDKTTVPYKLVMRVMCMPV